MKQDELAARVGVKPNTIWRWEHDLAEPRRLYRPVLADVLGLDESLQRPKAHAADLPSEMRRLRECLEGLRNSDAQQDDLEPGVRELLEDENMISLHTLTGDEIDFLKALRAGGRIQTPQQALMMVFAIRTVP